jgi:peroxiredoxin
VFVHWSPDCGFCESIASDLGRLYASLREHATELVLVSWGDVERNRAFAHEHGLDCPILLQEGSPPLELFLGLGTPVAYLLDEEGRSVGSVVVGADAVLDLARDLAQGRIRLTSVRSLSESRLERSGLKAGTVAPSFSLPGLDDRAVALEDFRGRLLLLVFSDPNCGPCDALAPDLARLHRQQAAGRLELIMVSRGDRHENARKAKEHGIEFPVALQQGWRLSKEFGIFETPVAFLIDKHGRIARDVARGSEQILALAAETLAGRGEVNERETIAIAQ